MVPVTVIMPCYNAGDFLFQAIESVLSQSFRDFEVIAVDDCSTDETLNILTSYAKKDERVRVIKNSRNLGLIKTLNKSIDLASGKYVARMDQDDISLRDRLGKQFEVLEKDNSLDLVACRWTVIDEKGRDIHNNLSRTFTTKSNLFESFFGPPFAHPTVMVRSDTIKKFYYRFSEDTKHIEDYDLWARMLLAGTRTKVLDDILFKYRNFSGNTTNRYHEVQSRNMISCGLRNLSEFLSVELSEDIQKTVFNRQETTIGGFELINAIDKFVEIKKRYLKKVSPNIEETKQINDFSANHVSDILIQYILKNEARSYPSIARVAYHNLSSLMNPRNLLYAYLKVLSLYRRRRRGE